MYEDRNVKIIFNTFLKSNDFRVDTALLNDLIAKENAAPATVWYENYLQYFEIQLHS